MTDMSNHPAPAVDVEKQFRHIEDKVDRAHQLLGVLDETFGNSLLVQLSLTTQGQRDAADQVVYLIEACRDSTTSAREIFRDHYHDFQGAFDAKAAAPARHAAMLRAADHPQIAAMRRKWAVALQTYRAADSAWSAGSTDENTAARLAAIGTLNSTPSPDILALLLKFQLLDEPTDQPHRMKLGWIEADVEALASISSRGFPIRSEAEAYWDTAMAAYQTALAAELEYETNVYNPAWDRQQAFEATQTTDTMEALHALRISHPDQFVPDEVSTEYDRLGDVAYKARSALIRLPAPNRPALKWKLDILLETATEHGSVPSWSADFIAQTQADIQRLLGGEG